jgi:hypothetical protein
MTANEGGCMNATTAPPVADAGTTAQTWVEGFAEGWHAPSGPDAFAAHFRPLLASDVRLVQPQLPTIVGHQAFEDEFVKPLFDGVAVERESYLDPSPILAAVARTPRAWPRFLRVQARAALANISRRRTR